MPLAQSEKQQQQIVINFKPATKTAPNVQLGLAPEIQYNGITGIFIEGWASVKATVDRYGDTIANDAFRNNQSVLTYFKLNPIILYEHGFDPVIGMKPLGHLVSYDDNETGLYIKAFIQKPTWGPMVEVYNRIRGGILKTLSIAGIWDRDYSSANSKNNSQEITSAELMEISVVATPANPMAVFDVVQKSFRKGNVKINRTPTKNTKKFLTSMALASLEYWTQYGAMVGLSQPSNTKAKHLAAKRIAQAYKRLEKFQ